jgi:hypothetical protein
MRVTFGTLDAGRTRFEPPLGLAKRTCAKVFACSQPRGRRSSPAALPRERLPEEATVVAAAGPGWWSRWSWADALVATAVGVVLCMLIFPAIHSSRFHARVAACQENLRQLGVALTQYSERHGGAFPEVPHEGPMAAAGIYAPVLLSNGYLDNQSRVVCPSSPIAADSAFRVPAIEELLSATGDALERLRGSMGGSYGYTLGYVENGQYRGPRNLRRATYAIMADAPALPALKSLNHDGRGQNVLFEDGHVEFLSTPQPASVRDNVFVNDTGEVAAGRHRDDAVVGASSAMPQGAPRGSLQAP